MAVDAPLAERLAGLDCPVDRTMLDPAIQDSPFDFYSDLHERCLVFPMRSVGMVMLTKYDDVCFVLTRPELFSSGGRGVGTKKRLQVDNARRYQQILRERGGGTSKRCSAPILRPTRRSSGWWPTRSCPAELRLRVRLRLRHAATGHGDRRAARFECTSGV